MNIPAKREYGWFCTFCDTHLLIYTSKEISMNYEEVRKTIIKDNGKPHKLLSKIYTKDVLDWIDVNVIGSNRMDAKVFCISQGFKEVPFCEHPSCSNRVEYRGTIKKGFCKFCSNFCAANSQETRKKYQESTLHNHGVTNPLKSHDVRNKMYATMELKYGSKTSVQSAEGKKKRKETIQAKYGVDEIFSMPEMQDRISQTNIKKYGHARPCQNVEIKEKMLSTRKIRSLHYKNTELYYQSKLELFFLEKMEEAGKLDLLKNGISFQYNSEDKTKTYVSDFYIPSLNAIIEIKSRWTFNNKGTNKMLEANNLRKWKSVIDSGYSFFPLIEEKAIANFVNTTMKNHA